MSKHTPGPWRLSPARNALGVVLGGPARPMHHGGTTVGQIASACSQEWMESGELEANAALIAAAPELLDAIRGLVDFIEIDEIKINALALESARDAISKAEGGAS